ncbi:MAG TPA: hypothetical protein VF647_12900 [Longimicrobium sp.]|jgi:hypothetical protein
MKETKIREFIPPMWPPDNFTLDEARQALREVEAEDEARRAAKRKRSRAASKQAPQDGGEDP